MMAGPGCDRDGMKAFRECGFAGSERGKGRFCVPDALAARRRLVRVCPEDGPWRLARTDARQACAGPCGAPRLKRCTDFHQDINLWRERSWACPVPLRWYFRFGQKPFQGNALSRQSAMRAVALQHGAGAEPRPIRARSRLALLAPDLPTSN